MFNLKKFFFFYPLLVKPNSVIAVGNDDARPDYDYSDHVAFHAFEIGDGSCAESTVYNISGDKALHISVKREGQKINVEVIGSCIGWSVYLRGIKDVESVSAGDYIIDDLGVKIISGESNKVKVMLISH